MSVTIGRVVLYRTDGRNGLVYDLPAIVTCTKDSHPGDYPGGEKNPLPVPDDGCVHLTVFTPGGFGSKINEPDGDHPRDGGWPDAPGFTPGSGSYVEWNVPQATGDPVSRSWRWPERV